MLACLKIYRLRQQVLPSWLSQSIEAIVETYLGCIGHCLRLLLRYLLRCDRSVVVLLLQCLIEANYGLRNVEDYRK